MELLAVLAVVVSFRGINAGAPQSALEVGDGCRVGAPVSPDSCRSAVVGTWVDGWVTLNVQVEGSAERSVVAVGSALAGVVGLKSIKTNVRRGLDGRVQVSEHLGVDNTLLRASNNSRSCRRHGVEGSIRLESCDSVGGRNRSVS